MSGLRGLAAHSARIVGAFAPPTRWTDTLQSEALWAACESITRVLCARFVVCGELGEEAVAAPLWCLVHGVVTRRCGVSLC